MIRSSQLFSLISIAGSPWVPPCFNKLITMNLSLCGGFSEPLRTLTITFQPWRLKQFMPALQMSL
jgi:hypothetical protein